MYKYSDVFIFPTREDIWGLVINEAMACGLPIISTTSCIAATELIEQENLYNSNDIKNLKKLINKYNKISNELLYKEGINNLNKIKNYTIENMVKEHIIIFEQILERMK